MSTERKNPKSDLRKYYTVFLELGMVVVLIIFIIAMKVDLRSGKSNVDLSQEQETVDMKEVVQTQQKKKPPPPPKPQVPVEVPDDQIVEDQDINLDSELDLDEPLPEPPEQEKQGNKEEQIFQAVEQNPELIGGIAELQKKVEYPAKCRRANIEGPVYLKFVVNKQGNVSNVQVTRGLPSEACNQAAVDALKKYAKFRPGRQRGEPVNVRHSLRIVFRLQNR